MIITTNHKSYLLESDEILCAMLRATSRDQIDALLEQLPRVDATAYQRVLEQLKRTA